MGNIVGSFLFHLWEVQEAGSLDLELKEGKMRSWTL